MKSVFILSFLIVCTNISFAQPYCDFQGVDSLFVEMVDDTINFWNIEACAYCNSDFTISVSISADSIYIVQTDTVLNKTTCACLFDLRASIVGLPSGTYWAVVFREKLKKYGYPVDTLQYVGALQFKYALATSAGLSYSIFQSQCLPSSVGEKVTDSPSQCTLLQNYPNPFNPVTTINYVIPRTSFVTIKLYDIWGRELQTLVNEEKAAGNYEVEFNGSNYSSNVYFCRMQAGSFAETKKLILMK